MQEYAHAANVLMTFTSGKPATNILRPLRGEMSVPWQRWKSNHPNPETQPDLKETFSFSLHLRLQTSALPVHWATQPWTHYLLLIGVEGRQILKVWGPKPSVKISDFCDLSLRMRIESSNIKLYLMYILCISVYLILSYVVVATRSLAFELTGLADSQSDLNRLSNSLLGQKPHSVPSKNSLLASADPCFQHHPRAQKNMPLVG